MMHTLVRPRSEDLSASVPLSQTLIGERVAAALRASAYAPLKKLGCRIVEGEEAGVVELTGTLPTFFLKQMAQSIALRVKHVHRVENGIRVE